MIGEGGGRFHLVGKMPAWFAKLDRLADRECLSVSPAKLFPFLSGFMAEAESFWTAQGRGQLRTSAWRQALCDGTEVTLEASAALYDQARLLLIEPVVKDHDQQKPSPELVANDDRFRAQLQQTQKMEAIGTLASGIAHDFNNILSAIIGYAELVRMDLGEPSGVRRNLDQLLAAGDRAKSLVQQILAFSRQTDTAVQPTQIRLVIMEALKLIRASLPSCVRIQPKLSSRSFVRCDPTQIHQICINLLTNAGQAMGEDGGIITVRLDDVALDETFTAFHPRTKPGGYVRFSVTDTGSGIPDAVIGKIFDPFFTTKPAGRGTGMGLSVVHGIVTALDGAITVHNQVSRGCRFDVYLPVCMGKTDDLPVVAEEMPTGVERVLFVDDEVFQADVGHQLLARLGYDVTASTDSVEALSLFEKDPSAFDLVVTDMTMPRLSGKRLAQRMRAIRPDVPMILCSGFSSSIDESNIGEMGFSAYLKKPLMIKEMADAVRQALDGAQAGSRS